MKNFRNMFVIGGMSFCVISLYSNISHAWYSDELYEAYSYAYQKSITTQPSIIDANMYGSLIRSHMAKMMVNYAIEVLGKTPDTSLVCDFTDVKNQTVELQGYITKACQLGLMGVDSTEFNPNDVVTRAQFGTVLSRALYGEKNNMGTPYYAKHLQALMDSGIMNIISHPNAVEVRGYIMLMMMRADEGITSQSQSQSQSIGGLSILLGRPTQTSVTFNMFSQSVSTVMIQYGTTLGTYPFTTGSFVLQADIPKEITIEGLTKDTTYFYKIQNTEQIGSFHTARDEGKSFTFAIEADPHMDDQSSERVYTGTLQHIAQDTPDFLIDLGDTFMSDKLPSKTYETIQARQLLFRDYFDYLQGSVPLYLVLGNHEGEAGRENNGTEHSIAVRDTNIRKMYYPNPFPNAFYGGDITVEPFVGLREGYYSFQRGDALFVMIDPYRNTENKPAADGRERTLGKTQYDRLQHTLEQSDAKYKFIFSHQLVGGDSQGRGGVELADFYERGGENLDSTYGFATYRAGRAKPIHELLVDNHVTVVFKGHDHLYAKQELDGIIYQTVPQPSHPGDKINAGTEYGYIQGTMIGGSGYLRVKVSSTGVIVQFLKWDGTVVAAYEIA